MNTQIIIPVESIHPFFEWDIDSKEIMEKDMGFVITHFSMQLTKENWLIVNASWKLNDEKDRGYLIKYPRFNGHSSTSGGGTDEVAADFFFPEIEADKEALRFDYEEKERRYNGFGKVGFSIGIEVKEEIARDPLYDLSCDELLNMAREKGVKFPLNYQLPYNHQGYIKCTPFDARFKYGIRNDKELREAEERGAERIEMVTIRHYNNPWYNIFGIAEAKKQINVLNKRHIIVAMQSENPNFPVLL